MSRVLAVALLLFALVPAQAEIVPGQRSSWPAIKDIDGNAHDPSVFLGRTVVVVFWATWCPLCRTELPEIKRFHAAFPGKEVEVLALSLDDSPLEVRDYLRRARLPFRVAMQTPAIGKFFGQVDAIPTTLVFDRHGVLRFRHVGAIDAEQLRRVTAPLIEDRRLRAAKSTAD